jgi:hypothetical protein
MKFCGQCGTQVLEVDLFCTSCGHELGRKVTVSAPKPDGTSAPETPIAESPTRSGKRRWYKRRAIVIPTAIVVAVFVLAVVFGDPEDDSSSTAAPVTTAAPATSVEPASPSTSCLTDMEAAASISEMAATAADLDPTFTSCTSVEEWQAAAIATGEAERIDISAWIPTRCEYEHHLKNTPLCEAHALVSPTTTDAAEEQFDSVDWQSFYDWCLDHRGYWGVDCHDRADDLQDWVNNYPEFEDCGLKAAKWYAVETKSDDLPLSQIPYVLKLQDCLPWMETSAPTATNAAATAIDQQALMGRSADGFSDSSGVEDLVGANICSVTGSTGENLTEALFSQDADDVIVVTVDGFDGVVETYIAGVCDVVTADHSTLVDLRERQQPAGERWVIFGLGLDLGSPSGTTSQSD